MMSKEKLVFDITDTDTIADSDSVGAYVRSDDGTLITHTTVGSEEHLNVYSATADGSGNPITSSGGALDVNIQSSDITFNVDITNSAEYAEDAGHTTADIGNYVLAVRADTRPTDANTDADADYASFFVNNNGELYVHDTDALAQLGDIETDLETINTTLTGGIDVNLQDGAGNDISSQNGCLRVADIANTAIESTTKSVTTTTGVLLAAELANRKYMYVQNNGGRVVYVGKSGVTTANGLRLSPGAVAEFRLGPALSLHGVAAGGTQDVRIMELS
jgi:hypothetical protein